jgi:peptide methionine sulfoxide reductase msrA/msrB
MKPGRKLTILLVTIMVVIAMNASANENENLEEAVFAGGCFWCMEPPFEKLDGVRDVISGYTGGEKPDPTYGEVSSGTTGHMEAVIIRYDPAIVSYEELLNVFWRQIDPTDAGGQFVDRGPQYRSAIFYLSKEQKRLAESSREALGKSARFPRPIVTGILPARPFYPAEDYHQDYYRKNPLRYKFYRYNSGRDRFLKKAWGIEKSERGGGKFTRPSDEELRRVLTPIQYEVIREEGTEPPFKNAYWDEKREGIYVDIVSGEPLFSSRDKYDSGTGWPSFTHSLEPGNIVEREDRGLFMKRTEVRSRLGDSHLGHVFPNGPGSNDSQRYCINSAALRFVPREDLAKEGYGEYIRLFEDRD